MAKENNKNKQIWMKFRTRRFLRSPLLKLETQKYRKVLIWHNYRIFTVMFFLTKFNLKL